VDTPRNLSIAMEGNAFKLAIGDHDLSDLPVLGSGPIVECLTPGHKKPAYVAWIPVFFEGEISDPNHLLRIVHEGEAEALALPSVEAKKA
jgi:hypothetical protein